MAQRTHNDGRVAPVNSGLLSALSSFTDRTVLVDTRQPTFTFSGPTNVANNSTVVDNFGRTSYMKSLDSRGNTGVMCDRQVSSRSRRPNAPSPRDASVSVEPDLERHRQLLAATCQSVQNDAVPTGSVGPSEIDRHPSLIDARPLPVTGTTTTRSQHESSRRVATKRPIISDFRDQRSSDYMLSSTSSLELQISLVHRKLDTINRHRMTDHVSSENRNYSTDMLKADRQTDSRAQTVLRSVDSMLNQQPQYVNGRPHDGEKLNGMRSDSGRFVVPSGNHTDNYMKNTDGSRDVVSRAGRSGDVHGGVRPFDDEEEMETSLNESVNKTLQERKKTRISRIQSSHHTDGLDRVKQIVERQKQSKAARSSADTSHNSSVNSTRSVTAERATFTIDASGDADQGVINMSRLSADKSVGTDGPGDGSSVVATDQPLPARVYHTNRQQVAVHSDEWNGDSVPINIPRKVASAATAKSIQSKPAAESHVIKSVDSARKVVSDPISRPVAIEPSHKPTAESVHKPSTHLAHKPPAEPAHTAASEPGKKLFHRSQPSIAKHSSDAVKSDAPRTDDFLHRKPRSDITPSSWRQGADLVRQTLGPTKRHQGQQPGHSPPTRDVSQRADVRPVGHTREVWTREPAVDHNDVDVAVKPLESRDESTPRDVVTLDGQSDLEAAVDVDLRQDVLDGADSSMSRSSSVASEDGLAAKRVRINDNTQQQQRRQQQQEPMEVDGAKDKARQDRSRPVNKSLNVGNKTPRQTTETRSHSPRSRGSSRSHSPGGRVTKPRSHSPGGRVKRAASRSPVGRQNNRQTSPESCCRQQRQRSYDVHEIRRYIARKRIERQKEHEQGQRQQRAPRRRNMAPLDTNLPPSARTHQHANNVADGVVVPTAASVTNGSNTSQLSANNVSVSDGANVSAGASSSHVVCPPPTDRVLMSRATSSVAGSGNVLDVTINKTTGQNVSQSRPALNGSCWEPSETSLKQHLRATGLNDGGAAAAESSTRPNQVPAELAVRAASGPAVSRGNRGAVPSDVKRGANVDSRVSKIVQLSASLMSRLQDPTREISQHLLSGQHSATSVDSSTQQQPQQVSTATVSSFGLHSSFPDSYRHNTSTAAQPPQFRQRSQPGSSVPAALLSTSRSLPSHTAYSSAAVLSRQYDAGDPSASQYLPLSTTSVNAISYRNNSTSRDLPLNTTSANASSYRNDHSTSRDLALSTTAVNALSYRDTYTRPTNSYSSQPTKITPDVVPTSLASQLNQHRTGAHQVRRAGARENAVSVQTGVDDDSDSDSSSGGTLTLSANSGSVKLHAASLEHIYNMHNNADSAAFAHHQITTQMFATQMLPPFPTHGGICGSAAASFILRTSQQTQHSDPWLTLNTTGASVPDYADDHAIDYLTTDDDSSQLDLVLPSGELQYNSSSQLDALLAAPGEQRMKPSLSVGSDIGVRPLRRKGADDIYPPHRAHESDTSRSLSPVSGHGDQSTNVASPSHEVIVHRLKIKLDKRYLTAREQHLRQRRAKAEKLLAWKQKLDEEEKEIEKLELEAAKSLPSLPPSLPSPSVVESPLPPESVDATSEQSEVELRVRNLQQELERRKLEAKRLQKEQLHKRKQQLHEQERQLSQQLQKYVTESGETVDRNVVSCGSTPVADDKSQKSDHRDFKDIVPAANDGRESQGSTLTDVSCEIPEVMDSGSRRSLKSAKVDSPVVDVKPELSDVKDAHNNSLLLAATQPQQGAVNKAVNEAVNEVVNEAISEAILTDIGPQSDSDSDTLSPDIDLQDEVASQHYKDDISERSLHSYASNRSADRDVEIQSERIIRSTSPDHSVRSNFSTKSAGNVDHSPERRGKSISPDNSVRSGIYDRSVGLDQSQKSDRSIKSPSMRSISPSQSMRSDMSGKSSGRWKKKRRSKSGSPSKHTVSSGLSLSLSCGLVVPLGQEVRHVDPVHSADVHEIVAVVSSPRPSEHASRLSPSPSRQSSHRSPSPVEHSARQSPAPAAAEVVGIQPGNEQIKNIDITDNVNVVSTTPTSNVTVTSPTHDNDSPRGSDVRKINTNDFVQQLMGQKPEPEPTYNEWWHDKPTTDIVEQPQARLLGQQRTSSESSHEPSVREISEHLEYSEPSVHSVASSHKKSSKSSPDISALAPKPGTEVDLPSASAAELVVSGGPERRQKSPEPELSVSEKSGGKQRKSSPPVEKRSKEDGGVEAESSAPNSYSADFSSHSTQSDNNRSRTTTPTDSSAHSDSRSSSHTVSAAHTSASNRSTASARSASPTQSRTSAHSASPVQSKSPAHSASPVRSPVPAQTASPSHSIGSAHSVSSAAKPAGTAKSVSPAHSACSAHSSRKALQSDNSASQHSRPKSEAKIAAVVSSGVAKTEDEERVTTDDEISEEILCEEQQDSSDSEQNVREIIIASVPVIELPPTVNVEKEKGKDLSERDSKILSEVKFDRDEFASLIDEAPPVECNEEVSERRSLTGADDTQTSETGRSEDLDRIISNVAAAVESFAIDGGDDRRGNVDGLSELNHCQAVAEAAASKLMVDAIDQMLTARSQKMESLSPIRGSRPSGPETVTSPQSLGTVSPARVPSGMESMSLGGPSMMDLFSPLRPGILEPLSPLRAGSTSPVIMSPVDNVKSSASDSSEAPVSAGEEWLDDELLGIRPPPPYPATYSDSTAEDMKAPFTSIPSTPQVKLSAVPMSIVPRDPETLVPLMDLVIDQFWESRRYGETWEGTRAPDGFYHDSASGLATDAMNRRVYRHLVFDLVAENLADVYRNETDDNEQSTLQDMFASRPVGRRVRSDPPTTLGQLKPIVHGRVLKQLRGIAGPDSRPPSMRWNNSRKKQDNVDWLLVRELREEEPGWVDYSAEECTVKEQLVESLFELLLNDTINTARQAAYKRHAAVS